jgi:hypothetical protein
VESCRNFALTQSSVIPAQRKRASRCQIGADAALLERLKIRLKVFTHTSIDLVQRGKSLPLDLSPFDALSLAQGGPFDALSLAQGIRCASDVYKCLILYCDLRRIACHE